MSDLEELFARFADAIASRISIPDPAPSSPWLTQAQAADYLCCSVSRVRVLTLTGQLPHHRDGRRPLYHRDELDAYVRSGGASCP